MFLDSSSDSAASSDDAEYSDGDVLESHAKGEIVKEGFLMKKVISFNELDRHSAEPTPTHFLDVWH